MKRKKVLKITIVILLLLMLALAGGVVLLYNFYPKDSVLTILSAQAGKELKRTIVIETLDYSLRGIVLHKLKLHNGAKDCPGVFASADDAIVRFSLLKLIFKREFDINFVNIVGLNLNICYRDGASNLENLIADLSTDDSTSFAARLDTIRLSRARISLRNPPSYLKPLEGEYLVDGIIDFTGEKSLTFSDAAITLPEKRGTLFPDLRIILLKNDFEISGTVSLERCALGWVYRWGTDLTLPYQDFSGKVTNLKISRRSVEGSPRGTSILPGNRPLMVNGFCRVNIDGERVFISNTQGSVLSSSFLIEDFLFDFHGNIRKFSIKNIDARIDDIRPVLPFLPEELNGTAKGSLALTESGYNGTLQINAGYGQGDAIVKNAHATVTISANRIQWTPAKALLFNQPFDITFSSTDGAFRKFQINASGAEFILPQNLKKTITQKPPDTQKTMTELPFDVSGTVSVGTLTIDQFSFGRTSAVYSLSRKRLSFGPVQSEFMGGEVRVKGSVDLAHPNTMVDCSVNFDRLRVQNLSRLSERFKDRIFGLASGNAELNFSLSENIEFHKSLRGKMEFTIDRGKLVDTGIQNGLGILLSDLKYKLKDLEFSKIYGNFTISGNEYQINSFLFSAPDVRLKLDGYINTELEGDLKIDLEFTRQFIQDLPNPVLLQLNKYKRDRWFVIPFQSKGKDVSDSKNIIRLQ
ncbi:MAG TPA: AsmA-like C-terminal region-containing protein [Spirochaetota bacterium]|nr:AsmA-like C-terminal region-containing protein [Spirochaetota bacterium]